MAVADALCRKMGISRADLLYRWKKQYGCLEPDQAREAQANCREENARLKKLVADLSLDRGDLAGLSPPQKWSGPRWECRGPGAIREPPDISLRRAAANWIPGIEKHVLLPVSVAKDPKTGTLRRRVLRELANTRRVRWGVTDGCVIAASARGLAARTQPVAICALLRGATATTIKLPRSARCVVQRRTARDCQQLRRAGTPGRWTSLLRSSAMAASSASDTRVSTCVHARSAGPLYWASAQGRACGRVMTQPTCPASRRRTQKPIVVDNGGGGARPGSPDA